MNDHGNTGLLASPSRVDNLDVVRSIAWLLEHGRLSKPLPLVKDGDLIATVQHMISAGEAETVRITKVKGHAAEADVEQRRVRAEDRLGYMEADTAAADSGRRHQEEAVMDIRRAIIDAKDLWYPIMLLLHRFMVAISRVAVYHNGQGGTALDPLVWGQGVGLSCARLKHGFMRIWLNFLALPVSCTGLRFRQTVGASRVRT